ncbi:MAG: hypothetical protein WCB02_16515 [Bradyrhizobium sp.]
MPHMIQMDPAEMKRIGPSASIRVGSLWAPVKHLPEVLAPFTKLLFCLNHTDDAHPYSLRGSATGLRFSGQHLLFCCVHQIADRAPGDVVVPVDKRGEKLVSGTRFIRINELPEFAGEEILDVCAMHFKPDDYGEPQLERGFFDIKGADVWNGEPQTTFLVYGYPSSLRQYGVDEVSGELNDLKVKMTATAGHYSHQSSATGLHAITLERSGTYSSDGLSGGAVYHVGEDAAGFYCGFAGIVVRGSDTSNIIHFMDAQLIREFFLYNQSLENR